MILKSICILPFRCSAAWTCDDIQSRDVQTLSELRKVYGAHVMQMFLVMH